VGSIPSSGTTDSRKVDNAITAAFLRLWAIDSPQWAAEVRGCRDATVIDEHTASYRGYTIRMTRTADRQRFEISIVPNGGACAISWFSNEKNVIYAGHALGCPPQ
jgi:hypothetical protein